VKKTIEFDLMKIKTYDGVVSRTNSFKIQPAFASSSTATRVRYDKNSPYGEIKFLLSDRTQRFDRIYPNLIEFFSIYGGIVEVIFVTCSVITFFHHYVIMDQQIVNKAILSTDKKGAGQPELGSLKRSRTVRKYIEIHTKEFTYWEMVKFKLLPFCNKKSERFQKFKQIVTVISERMDISNMVTNCGNIDLLSSVLLKPY